mgnify:CR=1 FL=1
MFSPDANQENADWLRQRWLLPPYKSEEFMRWLSAKRQTLEWFRKTQVYKAAVEVGLIRNDEWVGDRR